MSIINKMHQDFQKVQQEQPIIAQMPEKKGSKKPFLIFLIILLIGTAFGLSYLIFTQENKEQEVEALVAVKEKPVTPIPVENMRVSEQPVKIKSALVKDVAQEESVASTQEKNAVIVEREVSVPKKEIIKKEKVVSQATTNKQVEIVPEKKVVKQNKIVPPVQNVVKNNADNTKESKLEIKTAQLSKAELAQLHIKEAIKLEKSGQFELSIEKRKQALALVPTLNDVRESLALYYYGKGNIDKTKSLLQTGAVVSPGFSNFNLMLSRIAFKEGAFQKAYLYLEQHPPVVAGHIDYYVSHAILAQKLHKYEQSERLYGSLLSQRSNNGRWRMSLAIAQDKQGKIKLAIKNYENAILQTDLSVKAKDFINQRITYLRKTL